jgi:hypothetical protein
MLTMRAPLGPMNVRKTKLIAETNRSEPGINLGSTWGQPGVNLGITWGQPGVNLGII